MNDLENIFKKVNCDKHLHMYHNVYETFFANKVNEKINILEIGVFRGESIEAWLKYFPNATIYVIDTFERISENDIKILNHKRVKWYKGDSTNLNLNKVWNTDFDFIIDDGSHTANSQRRTFHSLFKYLKRGGFYFIEDVFSPRFVTNYELNFVDKQTKKWYDIHCSKQEYDSLIEAIRTQSTTFDIFNLNRISKMKYKNSCLLVAGK